MADTRAIDSAIDRLDEALRAAGLAGLEPPADVALMAELDTAVAPYALPAELRSFWEQVDPDPIAVFVFPMLRGPAAALELLHGVREIGATGSIGMPSLLLPFDYASHCYGVIELDSEWSEGGTIFEWDMDELPLVSRSLADRIDVLAELVSEGRFERGDGFVSIDHRAEQEKRLARLDASGPHPVYPACVRSRASSSRGRPTGSSRAGSTSATASRSARPTRSPSSSPRPARVRPPAVSTQA